MIAAPDRSEAWRSLLVTLTQASERVAVHGDVREGFAGEGDVDLVAPRAELALVEDAFRAWAAERGLAPAPSCRHRQGALILVALGAPDEPFWELEVRHERYFKGWTMWRAEELFSLTLLDPEGYRRIRPGAAGMLKLVPNGLRPGGRPKWDRVKRERVAQRLRADPEGERAAAALLGAARCPAVRLGEAVAAGGWDRRAAAALEAWALLRGLGEVPTLVRRVRGRRARCTVLDAVARGRVVELPEQWLVRAAHDHDVVASAAGTAGVKHPSSR
jgi:hypothetical protein